MSTAKFYAIFGYVWWVWNGSLDVCTGFKQLEMASVRWKRPFLGPSRQFFDFCQPTVFLAHLIFGPLNVWLIGFPANRIFGSSDFRLIGFSYHLVYGKWQFLHIGFLIHRIFGPWVFVPSDFYPIGFLANRTFWAESSDIWKPCSWIKFVHCLPEKWIRLFEFNSKFQLQI